MSQNIGRTAILCARSIARWFVGVVFNLLLAGVFCWQLSHGISV
jgi:hypothetical protein